MSEKTKKINPEIQKEDDKNDVSTDDLDKNTSTNENDKTNENTSKLNDSQDFTLNFEASQANELDNESNLNDKKIDSDGDKPITEEARLTENTMTIDKQCTDEKTDAKVAVEPEKMSIDTKPDDQNGNDDKTLNTDDDDEVIQGTSEDTPLKRSLVAGAKRKSDDSDDQTPKKPRTLAKDEGNSEKLEKQDNKKEAEKEISETKAPESLTDEKLSENADDNEKTKSPSTETSSVVEEKTEKQDEKMEIDGDTVETNQCNGAENKEENSLKIDENKSKDATELADIPISSKNRMSIEVIFDKSKQPPPKPRELIEIDESGEKILLNSSQETTINTTQDLSTTADISLVKLSDTEKSPDNKKSLKSTEKKQLTNGNNSKKLNTPSPPLFNSSSPVKQKQPVVCNLVSDSENDSYTITDDTKLNNNKTKTIESSTTIKMTINTICQYDEVTKEFISKEFVSASLDTVSNSDHSSLADSSAKESSTTGSVASDPRVHKLNPRVSILSSGSSEVSDTSSTVTFVRNSAKNQKKKVPWSGNSSQLLPQIFQFVEDELLKNRIELDDAQNGIQDDTLEKVTLPSSTPEIPKSAKTPGTGKRGRGSTRAKSLRTNGVTNPSPVSAARKKTNTVVEKEVKKSDNETNSSSGFTTPVRTSSRVTTSLRNQTPINDKKDKLIGTECFGKWSNHFYPGKVTGKDAKGGFNFLFFDGAKSTMSPDNVFPITTLRQGHSIFIVLQDQEYKSAMITSISSTGDNNKLIYTVETDDKETHNVELKQISLTQDQATIIREEYNSFDDPLAPVMKIVGFENVIDDGKKSKSTPTSVKGKNQRNVKGKKSTDIEATSSGVVNLNISSSDTDGGKVSDANDEDGFGGLQEEICEMAKDFATKGPQTRIKGKARSKKKDDPKIIEEAGPIPESGSTLFQGKGFIIVCAPAETLDKFTDVENAKEDSYSEPETDYEGDWMKMPFLRERLTAQLTAGGGIVYENFEDIPTTSYESTYMISNLPNSTAKGLLCLSVGIRSYNHRWVIRCCKENQLVSLAHEELPSGWSLRKQMYIEFHQRPSKQPFAHQIIAIPKTPRNAEAIKIWAKIIENAGGVPRIIESSADSFPEATAVLTNSECPSWVQEIAAKWKIPLLAPAWVKQCLIEGRTVDHDSQYVYQYNYKKQKTTK